MVTETVTEKAATSPLDVLRRTDAPMAEVMQALTALDRSEASFRSMSVGIAANVTVDLLATYLRRHAYLSGVRLTVHKGHYDDLLGDVQSHCAAGVDLLFVLPFFDNLQPSFEAQLDRLDAARRQAPVDDYLQRLKLALSQASRVGTVIVAGTHAWQSDGLVQQQAIADFNAALRSLVAGFANARFLDTASVVATIGTRQAFDARFYYRGKAPYTPGFLNELSHRVALATRSFGSVFHKVLVLDCDNTLWGGIVGEDGLNGLKLDVHNYPGNIFWTVQQQVLALERQGVLVCLCSKNNEADVAEVLAQHPQMAIKAEHVVARRVNWTDKPSNLKALAAELNLGLDSFVFVDDSPFEVQAVREQLPQVRVFQVPQRLTDYPALMREVSELFTAGGVSDQSRSKTQQYRELAEAQAQQAQFASQEEYLQSLGLKVCITRNDASQVARISELTQKSNQFNLTTRRLMPGDVTQLMQGPASTVYSFTVSDRLSEHGLTGVIVTEDEGDAVVVHSFLMSCRVIGRGVEFSVWKAVLADAGSRGKAVLRAAYVPTAKNAQVSDFYDRLGLKCTGEGGDGSRQYEAPVATVVLADSNWVELLNG